MSPPPKPLVSHVCIDADDLITDVGGQWDDFALANDGARVVADRVRGTWLYDHVSGDVSRMYVRAVLGAVRTLGREVTRAYRCDSPRLKRFMEMIVSPQGSGELRIEHRLLRVEPLPRVLEFVVGARARAKPRVRCSMCNRLKVGEGWQEPEEACEVVRPATDPAYPEPIPVVYGVCSSCLAGIRGHGAAATASRHR